MMNHKLKPNENRFSYFIFTAKMTYINRVSWGSVSKAHRSIDVFNCLFSGKLKVRK